MNIHDLQSNYSFKINVITEVKYRVYWSVK